MLTFLLFLVKIKLEQIQKKEVADMDILNVALLLESDLEKYYIKHADLNKDNSLHIVFTLLSKEEKNHGKLLKSMADNISYDLEESTVLVEAKQIFKNLDNFKSAIASVPSQLEAYRMALDMEIKSFHLYEKLHESAIDEKSKEIFDYLLKQEDNHRIILEELIKLVTRPEEWVESAEFGIREDY